MLVELILGLVVVILLLYLFVLYIKWSMAFKQQAVFDEEKRNTPIEVAKEMGAMALFGEKYEDK